MFEYIMNDERLILLMLFVIISIINYNHRGILLFYTTDNDRYITLKYLIKHY